MEQSPGYRKVFVEKYDEYSKYEIPIAKAVMQYLVMKRFELLFRPSTEKEDQAGIDIVSIFENMSCRSTPYTKEKWERFKYCFTIRTQVEVSHNTEFQKIWNQEGASFFGRGWIENDKVRDWMLIDLKALSVAFRAMHERGVLKQKCRLVHNKENATSFINCDIRDFPKKCLVAASFM